MCGIIGFVGKQKAQDILLDGLEKLEYRGYDSAGIAWFKENGGISVRKTAGNVKDLRAICDENESTCGIGHTRWATHGGVTNANAHPHKCENIALIHNGIIENYHELIEEFELERDLISETDTEVAAALFNKLYDGENPIETISYVVWLINNKYKTDDMLKLAGRKALGFVTEDNIDKVLKSIEKFNLPITKDNVFGELRKMFS